jgi:hypothetical protein
MMELDGKYASVILRRMAEYWGSDENISVFRDGKEISYSNLVKSVKHQGDS